MKLKRIASLALRSINSKAENHALGAFILENNEAQKLEF
jgi:hypothetical protein